MKVARSDANDLKKNFGRSSWMKMRDHFQCEAREVWSRRWNLHPVRGGSAAAPCSTPMTARGRQFGQPRITALWRRSSCLLLSLSLSGRSRSTSLLFFDIIYYTTHQLLKVRTSPVNHWITSSKVIDVSDTDSHISHAAWFKQTKTESWHRAAPRDEWACMKLHEQVRHRLGFTKSQGLARIMARCLCPAACKFDSKCKVPPTTS